jgi:hypothetical protein
MSPLRFTKLVEKVIEGNTYKALHQTAILLRSIAAGELSR